MSDLDAEMGALDTGALLLQAREESAQGVITLEAEVRGQSVPLNGEAVVQPECSHDREIRVNTTAGFVKDAEGGMLDWQLRVRAECADCDAPFSFATKGRAPADGGPGVVMTLRPIDREPRSAMVGEDGTTLGDHPSRLEG